MERFLDKFILHLKFELRFSENTVKSYKYDLNKSQQLDTLKSLGISDSLAKSFKYEADRVSKIEELYKERKNEVLPYNYKK